MRAFLMVFAGWFAGLIGGALFAAVLGYWSSGAVVGFSGVGIYGWAAGLLLMFAGSVTGAVAGYFGRNMKWPFKKKAVDATSRDLAALTAEAGRCALFFRGILSEDTQAQVLIDELLVRATRAACGVKTDADYQVQITKSGGVNFQPKSEE